MDKALKGVVLRYTHFGETSAILNILTENSGILSALFHGIKKRGGNYGVGTLVEWQASKKQLDKNSLVRTSKYEIIGCFSFGGDIEKISFRDCAIELILLVVEESGDSRDLFALLIRYLNYLEKVQSDCFFAFWLFCVRLAQFLGYKINFDSCIECKSLLNGGFLSWENGGFLCRNCHSKPNFSAQILQILSKGGESINSIMQNIPQKEKIFITQQFIGYIQYHCGKKEKKLNSFEFFCKFVSGF